MEHQKSVDEKLDRLLEHLSVPASARTPVAQVSAPQKTRFRNAVGNVVAAKRAAVEMVAHTSRGRKGSDLGSIADNSIENDGDDDDTYAGEEHGGSSTDDADDDK